MTSAASTIRNSSPNLSRISSCHCDLEVGGNDDEDAARAVAEQELLDDQAGFDRLAEADVVSDEQRDAWHLQRADERVELVGVDLDAAAERRHVAARVGVARGPPANGVEEGVEACGVVEPVGQWEAAAFDRASEGLDLPDHAERLVGLGVVVDGAQRDEVLRMVLRLERVRRELTRLNVGNDPLAGTNLDELTDLGRRSAQERASSQTPLGERFAAFSTPAWRRFVAAHRMSYCQVKKRSPDRRSSASW